MRIYFFLLLILFLPQNSWAQVPPVSEQQAIEELSKRGITEEEFRERMKEKGYDLDNIQPEQLPQLEQVIRETVSELEQGKDDTQQVKNLEYKTLVDKENEEAVKLEEVDRKDTLEKEEIDLNKMLEVEIYGQQIFKNKTLEIYQNASEVKPPSTYVLGTGDELVVSIFGISQAEFVMTINENGYIQPSRMPRIYLKGVTLARAEQLIRQRFAQYYVFSSEQFTLTVNTARTLTVNIFGEVENFGSFTLPAVNTAFNALVAAGGPTEIGTIRNIKLIRGRETREIDVYEFLFNPSVQYDYFLQNNDIIHVPTSEKLIGIQGAVKRPFKYELLPDENLNALIQFAGGLRAEAYKKNIQITRIINNQRVVIDVNFEELENRNDEFELKDGDRVMISEIPERIENLVVIDGAVEFPNNYQLISGMRVGDLLEKGTLREDARLDIAFLRRKNTDSTFQVLKINLNNVIQNRSSNENILLQKSDRLSIFSQTQFADNYEISVIGAVRDSIVYPYNPDLTVQDAILLAGGLKTDAADFAYIIRESLNNPKEKKYIRVDLRAGINNQNSAENVTLSPKDQLEIPSKSIFSDEYFVRIEGAVRDPGDFQYDETLTLKDVLTLAGGLQLNAATNKIEIFRLLLNENQPTQTTVARFSVDENLNVLDGNTIKLEPFDLIVVRNVPDFGLQKIVKIEGEVLYPGNYPLIKENEKIVDLIDRSGGLTAEAFAEGAGLTRLLDSVGVVILELDKAIDNPNSRFNFFLRDGDIIEIPKNKDLVAINITATLANELYPDQFLKENEINVAYFEGKRAKWYIDEYAGGIARNKKARKRLITVENPNGEFKKSKNILFFIRTPKVEKGSIVRVGVKPKKEKEKKEKKEKSVDWDKVLTQVLATASAAATIVLAISALP